MMKTNALSKCKKRLIKDLKKMFKPVKKIFIPPFSDDENIRHYWAMFMIFC